MNLAIIIGNLGADPELRFTQGGTPVCNFSVATSEKWTDNDGNKQEATEWHKIVVWGKSAENCNEYLRKGSKACIQGTIKTKKWQDRDGNDRYTTEITAFRVEFLDSKPQGQGGGQGNQRGGGGYGGGNQGGSQQGGGRGQQGGGQRGGGGQGGKPKGNDFNDPFGPPPGDGDEGIPF